MKFDIPTLSYTWNLWKSFPFRAEPSRMKLWSNPQGWLTIHYFFFAESKIPSERKRFCSRQPWLVSCNETRDFENALIWKYPKKKDKLRKFLFFGEKKKLDFLSWNSLHGKVGVDRSGMEEEKPGRTFSPFPPPPVFPPVTPLRSEFNLYSVAKCFCWFFT